MTAGLIEGKTNGSSLSKMDQETLSKLVLNGDLSKLTEEQTLAYYAYRCKAVGLDPGTKPFDLLVLNGKKVMYATKECSAQISQRDGLSVTVVTDGTVGDIYRVVARAASRDGRATDDMGCVPIKGLAGADLCNAMMKATTKAKRRAILTHAGLGMMDETELETIPKNTTPVTVKKAAAPVSREQTAEGTEATGTATVEGNQEPVVTVDTDGMEPVHVKGFNPKPRPMTKGGFQYGILIEDANGEKWYSTFSSTVYDAAKALKGKDAMAKFEQNGEYTNLMELVGNA